MNKTNKINYNEMLKAFDSYYNDNQEEVSKETEDRTKIPLPNIGWGIYPNNIESNEPKKKIKLKGNKLRKLKIKTINIICILIPIILLSLFMVKYLKDYKQELIQMYYIQDELRSQLQNYEKTAIDSRELIKEQSSTISNLQKELEELKQNNTTLTEQNKKNDKKIQDLYKDNFNYYYPVEGSNTKDMFYLLTLLDEWHKRTDYILNVYDCSEQSAHLEWYLETNGIKAEIVVGYPSWTDKLHAWVWAYVDGGKYAIESTTKRLKYYEGGILADVDKTYYDKEFIRTVYPSINSIPQNEIHEYDWWSIK